MLLEDSIKRREKLLGFRVLTEETRDMGLGILPLSLLLCSLLFLALLKFSPLLERLHSLIDFSAENVGQSGHASSALNSQLL